ncbi:hypothetical protein BJ684DRAFT_6803, partial [Piptocephalis cylindrospora]
STLPVKLIELQSHPLVRIFRVLGGICVLLILTKKVYSFNEIILYIVILISLFYSIFLFYITYNRIKHIYSTLKKNDLEVRNSPLDKFATLASKLIFCAKGACDTIAPIGVSLGLLAGFDTILEHKGKDPIFLPFIADTF